MWTEAVAIALVIAAGVAVFVNYRSTFSSLRLTQQTYYERYRFADAFASLKRAPLRLEADIAAIPGVAAVQTRVVVDVTLNVEGFAEPVTGRLISIPGVPPPRLNDVFLRRGRYIDLGRPDEVIVNEAFALAHDLDLGDTVDAVINGRLVSLQIVGVGLSPEYVYSIRPGDLIPDDARFGILWVERRMLGSAFNMEGGFNDVTLDVLPGATVEAVLAALDRVLEPYGGLGAIPRARQISHWSIDNELAGLQGAGFVIPVIFLLVAAFLLNVVLTRIVSVQREQIAALKALGYANRTLGWHYTKWALGVAVVGTAVGIVGGILLGRSMTSLYNDYFRFPILVHTTPPGVIVQATAISIVAAIVGAVDAVRRVVALPPAEAMRPAAPARYRPSLVERVGLRRLLSPSASMTARNLERAGWRTALSVIGIGFSAAMLIVGLFGLDAVDELLYLQFSVAQRQDMTVTFVEPVSPGAQYDLAHLPGVLSVEPGRSVPARLRSGHRAREVVIQGVEAAPTLRRIVNTDGAIVDVPPAGLMLSWSLAEILAVEPGDVVTVEVLVGRRPVRTLVVERLIDEYMGTSAYMDAEALYALMGEGPVLSRAELKVDPSEIARLYAAVKLTPAIAGVTLKGAAVESFEETFAQNINILIFFNVFFAGIIAFGVVYNAARVSLSERSRELASLRVLGFTRGEIGAILLGELAIITALAIPVGIALGFVLAWFVVLAFSSELYRFPFVISRWTIGVASATVIVAATISGAVVYRRLRHLNLVEVLKTRE